MRKETKNKYGEMLGAAFDKFYADIAAYKRYETMKWISRVQEENKNLVNEIRQK